MKRRGEDGGSGVDFLLINFFVSNILFLTNLISEPSPRLSLSFSLCLYLCFSITVSLSLFLSLSLSFSLSVSFSPSLLNFFTFFDLLFSLVYIIYESNSINLSYNFLIHYISFNKNKLDSSLAYSQSFQTIFILQINDDRRLPTGSNTLL